MTEPGKNALVFAGGLGLAAYHAGAYEAFEQQGMEAAWVAGSSAGAITAALIAGNRREDRVAQLRSFWNLNHENAVISHPWQHLEGWVAALSAHVFGSIGHFHPRVLTFDAAQFRSLYDLAPMRRRLERLIDFGRLNGGEVRISVAATDVATGDPVVFDSSDGPIGMDHLMASCGFLPEFPQIVVDGRALVDGGFSINAPFDPILGEENESFTLFVLDLFARDGARPASLEAAAERKNDLMFGNQTYLRLKDRLEIRTLKRRLAGLQEAPDQTFLLSYRAGAAEPGPEKSFNFSHQGLATRWRSGHADMLRAIEAKAAGTPGLHVIRNKAGASNAAGGENILHRENRRVAF